ncbi:chemosensory protein 19 precursor [Tribolium castaneum]|uniref:Chemosensory protein 19 n=1 Tax=Tribolium castaneum TaxID=7070 RepID=Q0MRK4_TRICA|nr:chemosensory protein 19 precursor [Tribolium castaneum]ABH88192.1 chemosensory protein 19 [Tribolium castaneum]EFA07577.1 chemosensory protein 19 [Tribolium castaneum]|eukprot:NP_001039276.1 chemosensory protein 19 precursor [Tribolium castaneum]
MKFFIAFLMLLGAVWCEQYTTKYDNINVDEILASERLLKNYFNCIMDRGACTPDADELKRVLPDALKSDCAKCSEKQKEMTKKVIHFLSHNKQQMWKELTAKYDPDGIYFEKYKDKFDS